ncbi:hypothetical protein AAEX63_06315 [Luteococcus sp. H138]|uniref:hypothetical protein n=1 Tax=unclassified Luteococcus TaxID=2639923 RepID=UPI00313CD1D8
MTASTAPSTIKQHRARPWGPIIAMILAIVVMAITAFFHLIQHHNSLVPMIAPVLAGFFGAAFALKDKRMDHDTRMVWAAGLIFVGLAAVATAAVLMVYVLPLKH